jgi:hypothetical protein
MDAEQTIPISAKMLLEGIFAFVSTIIFVRLHLQSGKNTITIEGGKSYKIHALAMFDDNRLPARIPRMAIWGLPLYAISICKRAD